MAAYFSIVEALTHLSVMWQCKQMALTHRCVATKPPFSLQLILGIGNALHCACPLAAPLLAAPAWSCWCVYIKSQITPSNTIP
jgi:hypothetical protein